MIKKTKFWVKFSIQIIRRYGLIVLLSAALTTSIALILHKSLTQIRQLFPQTRRIGVVGKYQLSTLPPSISHLISYGLTNILPNGRATSSPIIDKWIIKDSGRKYIFYLKDDIYWQDGQLLKPEEINYQIKGAQFSTRDRAIIINLDSIFVPFPTLLDRPIFKKEKIGLGPYKIQKVKIRGGNFTQLLLSNQNNNRDRILFRFYPNEKSLINAFKLGEVDEIWEVTNINKLSSWKNIIIKNETEVNQRYVALFFNTRKEPFSIKRVRQALAYAIQKPPLKDRALGPIAPSSWAYNDKVKTYHFNPQHARKLLAKTEWQPQDNWQITISTLPEFIDWAEKIKSDWEEYLKFKAEIYVTNFIPDPNNFDVFLGYGVIPPDPDQYFFWHSTQQGNITGIKNPRIDQLLEKGRKTLDFEKRRKIYHDFQRALSEEVPAIFLFYPHNYRVIRR